MCGGGVGEGRSMKEIIVKVVLAGCHGNKIIRDIQGSAMLD